MVDGGCVFVVSEYMLLNLYMGIHYTNTNNNSMEFIVYTIAPTYIDDTYNLDFCYDKFIRHRTRYLYILYGVKEHKIIEFFKPLCVELFRNVFAEDP